jgi:hypothetical protein
MGGGLRTEVAMALAWLIFPMVPVLLAELYYQVVVNLLGSSRSGPDPYDWDRGTWLLMLGPLLGYGFLAGSTADVPDPPPGSMSRLRRVAARRAVWVAIGPWAGLLLLLGWFFGLRAIDYLVPSTGGSQAATPAQEGWGAWLLGQAWIATFFGILTIGWLWPAWAAIRRARRIGLFGRALGRGIATAMAFVGSLLGSFWAITSAWRGYFFDPRLMPILLAGLGVAALGGCGAPITYGAFRRRELFHAMLPAWVFGLAMLWWWASRRRAGRRRRGAPPEDPRSS